jgi:protoporphyrinogen oxidase
LKTKTILIIGAGPAGLTAAYTLAKANCNVIIIEKDAKYVGGISRTETFEGYSFDIGGHRFFSKSKIVENFWNEILEKDFLIRPRKSRIFYNKKFYSYPLKPFEALSNLGIITSVTCMFSFVKAQLFPKKNIVHFQDWVSNQFGSKLFNIFFKTYTEKVWGMPCTQISADWAAQRIKGLSLGSAIYNGIFNKNKTKTNIIKTLIDTFRYPRKGPGMMWEKCLEKILVLGGQIKMNTQITNVLYLNNVWHLTTSNNQTIVADDIISTMPLQEFGILFQKYLPMQSVVAAQNLKYRDFITVIIMMPEQNKFDDNWIYIHDASVKVGRIQNYKSWSPEMVPNATMACYGLEYFCFEGDGLWTSTDEALGQLAIAEMQQLGLLDIVSNMKTYVVRQHKAYPVYTESYKTNIEIIKTGLKKIPQVQVSGRNGMHKYNNQDHSMMTAMLAAKNIIENAAHYNIWNVNEDAEYHEQGDEKIDIFNAGRLTPQPILDNN